MYFTRFFDIDWEDYINASIFLTRLIYKNENNTNAAYTFENLLRILIAKLISKANIED